MATPDLDILGSLTHFLRERGAPQLFAWDRSLTSLKATFSECLNEAKDCELVLEYELPLSGGRRPDLIFLNNGTILVIEFKNRVAVEPADLDQVLGYARELKDYHEACHTKTLIPVLVPIGYQEAEHEEKGVKIVSPKGLSRLIRETAAHTTSTKPDSANWVRSVYSPLPALTDAARLIFENKPLPQIKTAAAAKIPEVVARIESIAVTSQKNNNKTLVLVTGVPGAGKTLVGLQCAYSTVAKIPSIFLSGNGPLVQVLKYQLDSERFVRDLKPYLREHLVRHKERPPEERIVIFDEAQRAWDRDRVLEKHAGELNDSEPALLLQVGNKSKNGFTVVALMGEGQEIHAGEESGIQNWVDAVSRHPNYTVHGPAHLAAAFTAKGLPYEVEDNFHLNTSLRSHRALEVAQWTNTLLEGDLATCKTIAQGLIAKGYAMKLSRDLQSLKDYVRDRYSKQTDKRIGVIASSKFRKLGDYGVEPVQNNFYYYGRWYGEGAQDIKSGCRLETSVSEFGCQGLELDMPLLCWGPDFRHDGTGWMAHLGKARKVKDPQKIRKNAYRVLMTRGRDGLAVFVPKLMELNGVERALKAAGMEKESDL